MENLAQSPGEIISNYDRQIFAAAIATRFAGRPDEPLMCDILAQQWYAEDLHAHEYGIATRFTAPDQSCTVWFFQSVANPTPGLVPTWRIVCYGNCDVHQAAADAVDQQAWSEILDTVPATGDGRDLF